MGKKYKSNKKACKIAKQEDKEFLEKVEILEEIEREIEKACKIVADDKYGELDKVTRKDVSGNIKILKRDGKKLYNYSSKIHDILDKAEFEYFKKINSKLEIVSSINLADFKTNRVKNGLQSHHQGYIQYTPSTLEDIYKKSDILNYQKLYDSLDEEVKKDFEDVKEFRKAMSSTLFVHEKYAEEWKKKVDEYVGFIPIVGAIKDISDSATGKNFSGEILSKSERDTALLSGVVSGALDALTFGLAGSGLKAAAKACGKKLVAKEMFKALGKTFMVDSATSLTLGAVANKIAPNNPYLQMAIHAIGGYVGAKALKSRLCFVAGTLIMIEQGYKVIEDIKIGDKVLAQSDDAMKKQDYREVVELFESKTSILIVISIDNQMIKCTENHQFYTVNRGWVEAKDLAVNDRLLNSENESVRIDGIVKNDLDEEVHVYNFEVEGYHTYYVSYSGVLVHNMCVGKIKSIDELLFGAIETTSRKGVTKNFEKTGGWNQASKEFENMGLNDVKDIKTKHGLGKVGKMKDGTIVSLRAGSNTGGTTIEIRISSKKIIKIRY